MSIESFVAKIHALRDDPNGRWSSSPGECDPGTVHEPADKILLEALHEAGYGLVADAYDELIQKSGGTFWYE